TYAPAACLAQARRGRIEAAARAEFELSNLGANWGSKRVLKGGFWPFFRFFPKAAIKSLPGFVFTVENLKTVERERS
ncbi:MAG: hypothetical protein NTX52_06930, partial [Planctomycetota bacterium]|nr:hypothetical protein [Planctomycetota bacterium]